MKRLALVAVLATQATAPKPLVIPLKAHNLIVCAEYLSDGAPRHVQRSCVDASRVREWLLANGRPSDSCE